MLKVEQRRVSLHGNNLMLVSDRKHYPREKVMSVAHVQGFGVGNTLKGLLKIKKVKINLVVIKVIVMNCYDGK